MPMLGTGALVIWCDVEQSSIEAHDEWHTQEHLPELIGLPGFLRATRWVDRIARPRYFIMYEVRDVATLTSPEYFACLNHPTPLTRKVMTSYQHIKRGYCRVVGGAGAGTGGTLTWVRFEPTKHEHQTVCDAICRHAGEIAKEPGVVTAHLLESAIVPPMTSEQAIRPDESVHCVFLVTTSYLKGGVQSWCESAALQGLFGGPGASGALEMGTCDLHYMVSGVDQI